ncbi:hypothetical protein T4B_2176 [Trichinella pseudospiralis]|uniref:Uncharacterized protein n=1 Tax=Trichinella pseudospiralis TaxID=6337 RepID=A0A0V1KFK0_TRIPS|nr:hypothetical protein T4B_2176 [Trichinella pseudospiralis]KRZ45589.1 hypothetical protein T4C_12423 [Trichinella pseudospiralis]
MHNEDLTAVDMQWQGKARQGKCRVSVEMKQITEISENPISRMYKVNIVKLKVRRMLYMMVLKVSFVKFVKQITLLRGARSFAYFDTKLSFMYFD